jgi:uncharacterized BrkB/YihY/UPF0761 family membrane protein
MTRRRNRIHIARELGRLPLWGRVAVGVTVALLLAVTMYLIVTVVVPLVLGVVILWAAVIHPIRENSRRERRNRRAIQRRYARRPR